MNGWRGHANFGQRPIPKQYRPPPIPYQPNPKKEPPKRKVIHIMSVALWCDSGNHAFSSKDKDATKFTKETEKENRYGDIVTEREDFNICGPHSKGMFQGEDKAVAVDPKGKGSQ